ncbi:hypothetical protein [Halomontanus rarus]|uniref:hypothetical protein n=1 Tax=Halomontanus rarus TaxID=3034020 RepID=UPI00293B98DE|nr:hypothetical protein [Halovivax sp. KZCA124]
MCVYGHEVDVAYHGPTFDLADEDVTELSVDELVDSYVFRFLSDTGGNCVEVMPSSASPRCWGVYDDRGECGTYSSIGSDKSEGIYRYSLSDVNRSSQNLALHVPSYPDLDGGLDE